MKNTILVGLVLIFTCNGCTKEEITFDNLITRIMMPDKELIADGSDLINVRLFFNKDADIKMIDAKATIGNAIFTDNDTNELVLKPRRGDQDNPGLKDEIFVDFAIKSTTKDMNRRLTLKVNEYEKKIPIISIRSQPSNIALSANAFSVPVNFQGEIEITGKLTNAEGKKVSEGTKTILMDLNEDGSPANGQFREEKLSSNSDSQISSIYTPGISNADRKIEIKVVVLDENNEITAITDSIEIYLTTIEG